MIQSSLKETTAIRKIKRMLMIYSQTEYHLQHQHLQHNFHFFSSSSFASLMQRNWRKKLALCLTFLIQCIICFWLMQQGSNYKLESEILNISISKKKLEQQNHEPSQLQQYRVNFIQSDARQFYADKANGLKLTHNNKNEGEEEFLWPPRELEFHDNFILHKSFYNVTENEHLMFDEATLPLWCFREGSQIGNTYSNLQNDDVNNGNNILWQEHCSCSTDWHGRDCGQPEVIWRALMTSRLTMKLQEPNRDERHRLICMIEGNFFNFDLLEIQLKTMDHVVDYFIIYWKRPKILIKNVRSLKQLLKQILIKRNYSMYYCNKVARLKGSRYFSSSVFVSSNGHACTSSAVYRVFRQQHITKNVIKSSDYFLYIDDFTILGHQALNFLKFYGSPITTLPIRFRLKYNVYSFYWQHKNLTHIGGVICSFNYLDNMLGSGGLVGSRSENFIKNSHSYNNNNNDNDNLVIGDLNHFAGWFCKYCQQPEQILQELQVAAKTKTTLSLTESTTDSTSTFIALPRNGRNSYIDANYIQKLIATGIYLNNDKMLLQRQQWQWQWQRQRQDQEQGQVQGRMGQHNKYYYAPNYVIEQNWKFNYLLENIYETLDDLLSNDYDDII